MNKKHILISIAIIAAACLAFYFYSQEKGYIEIDVSGATATLNLRSGWISSIKITSEAKPAKVSAKVYEPKRLYITAKQNGNTWQIYSLGPWGKLTSIKVKKNETTVLKLGPPFLIKPAVHRRGSQILIDFSIIGQAGEHYSAGRITKNKMRVSAPKLRIVDESEKVLAVGKFEYG